MIHRTTGHASRRSEHSALAAAPEYFALMRNLAGQADSPVIRSLGITSSRSGEGVSTIALQCALAAERLFRQPILLVEANIHRPSLHRTLRLDRAPGFGELLVNSEPREECIQRYDDKLFVTTCGNTPAASISRCGADSIARAMDSMHEGHRLTIWDLPAVGTDSFAIELASQLDGVLIVVESERVQSDAAEEATDRLRAGGAQVLGAILNKQRQHLPQWLASRL
jgi:Mrp family chromosome partitioning ATPase